MKQFLLPAAYRGEPTLVLRGRDFHYLCRVRRMGEGSEFAGANARGEQFRLVIQSVGRDHCTVSVAKISSDVADPTADLPLIVLVQCLPKGRKLDTIVRQATEAGVSTIVPVTSDHAVADAPDDSDRSAAKTERLRRIAREAFQQSGRFTMPDVLEPFPLVELAARLPLASGDIGIFFHQEPLATASLHGYLSTGPTRIVLVIGPEGGLAAREVACLRDAGYLPAYLGPVVLRAETASLYAIAAVRTIVLERKTWQIE